MSVEVGFSVHTSAKLTVNRNYNIYRYTEFLLMEIRLELVHQIKIDNPLYPRLFILDVQFLPKLPKVSPQFQVTSSGHLYIQL